MIMGDDMLTSPSQPRRIPELATRRKLETDTDPGILPDE